MAHKTRTVMALAAAASGLWAALKVKRRLDQSQAAFESVPPKFRHPLLRLVHAPHDGQPPQRDTSLARLLDVAVPKGLGRLSKLPPREGQPSVPVWFYDPPHRTRPSGAVVWIHGGGMITGAPWMTHAHCTALATKLDVLVLSVDYRLAPEHPFPAGLDDCFTAVKWLFDHAKQWGVDTSRIVVGGDSAGGGLAAMVAQMAHDRGLSLALQALVYPMLDDRTGLRDDDEGRGAVVWTRQHNIDAWGWFLGHPISEDEPRPYASAARRDDLSGLPPAWIGVGDRDLFYREDVDYAERLRAAGVEVELVTVEGMPHAGDIAGKLPEVKAFRESVVEAISRAVAPTPGQRSS